MAKTFKEILAETLDKRGISPDAMPVVPSETPPTTQTQPTAQVEPPVAEQPPVPPSTPPAPEPETPVETTAENGVEEEIPGFTVSDEPVTSEIPGFEIIDETPTAETEQVFDSSTIITPEMISGLDYDTLYDLSLQDSPLAPDQRLVIANALRGSSDLWDLFSGYESDLGAEDVAVATPKTRADILKNSQKKASVATAANTAILEAVKGVRAQYLKDNPKQQTGVVQQAIQSLVEGTAAPRPDAIARD